jgi:plastocyanin
MGVDDMKTIGCSLVFFSIGLLLAGCSKEQEKPAVETSSAKSEPAAPPAQSDSTQGKGTISGKIILKGSYKPGILTVGKDKEVCGASKTDPALLVGAQGEVKNAVIQIAGIAGKTAPDKEAVLDQAQCEYAPHVLVIPAWTTVKIRNNDGILHNVHTFSKINSPFNKAQPKYLKEFEHTFEKPEFISVKCDVHGWMSGWIVVTEKAHFTVSGADGVFQFADVPLGEHTVEVWHETLGNQTQKVKVAAKETANVLFGFSGKK